MVCLIYNQTKCSNRRCGLNRLREKRKQQKLKVEVVAKKLGVSTMAIYHYELGNRKLPLDKAKLLAELYQCKIDDLI